MKKIIFILMALVIMGNASFAQKQEDKAKTATTKSAAPKQKMKKDGTPDMRHKENKQKSEAAPAHGPLKKDGTPDMRHKANKNVEKEKSIKK